MQVLPQFFSRILILVLAILFTPLFVEAQTTVYNSFVCKYFNIILVPLGACQEDSDASLISDDEFDIYTVNTPLPPLPRVLGDYITTVTPLPQTAYTSTASAVVMTSPSYSFEQYTNQRFTGLLSHIHWLLEQKNNTSRSGTSDTDKVTISNFNRQVDNIQESQSDNTLALTVGGDFSEGTLIDFTITDSAFTRGTSTDLTLITPTLTSPTIAGNLRTNGYWISGDGDDEGLFIDTSGKVGVGTSTPTDRLSITDGAIYLEDYTPVTTTNRLHANGSSLYWSGGLIAGATIGTWDTNGTDVYRSTGNVGIGTTTPSSKLEIVGGDITMGNGYDLLWRNSLGATTSILELSGDTTFLRGGGGTPTLRIDNSSGTNLMAFLEGGSVGIGTTTPTEKFHVIGNGLFSGTLSASNFTGTSTGTNTGDVTLVGENYLSLAGQIITANSIDLSGTNATGTLASARVLGSYTGITGLGTIATGTWQGGVIVDAYLADDITISGGTIGSNNISGTLTTTGTLTIGDGGDTIDINTANWDISSAGVGSGFTGLTSSGTINFSGLTASRLVATDASSNLVSTITAANLASSVTGTTGSGNLVFSASPTFTGVATLADFVADNATTTNATSTNLYASLLRSPSATLTNATTTNLFATTLNLGNALTVANGGTGATTLTGLLLGNGTSAFTATTTLSSSYIEDSYVLNTGDSISGDLTFSGTSANIALGSNYLSGDGGDEGVFVDSTGNVGIGTVNPLGQGLHIVNGSIGSTPTNDADELIVEGIGNSGMTLLASINDSSYIRFGDSVDSSRGAIKFNNSDDSLSFYSGDTSFALKIDGSGNVGIGTSTPVSRLAIQTTGTTDILNLFETGGTEVLTVLESGNVGIGTSTPGEMLTVAGDYLGTGVLQIDGTGDSYIQGNVGIGTTTPSALLSVGATAGSQFLVTSAGAITSGAITSGLINGQTISSAANFTGTVAVATSVSTPSLTSASGALTVTPAAGSNFNLNLSTTGDFAVNTSQLYVDTSTGYVGMGTTAPGAPLHIWSSNAGAVTDHSNAVLILEKGTNPTLQFQSAATQGAVGIVWGDPDDNDAGRVLYSHTDDSLDFWTSGGERMTINSSGNVGIGTSTPGEMLTVAGDYLGTGVLQIDGTGDSYIQGNVGIGTTTPGTKLSVAGTVGFSGLTASVGAGSLCLSASNEVVYNSGSDSCLSSTRNTKHDITALSFDAIDVLNTLQPVSFIYNGTERVRYGFIAEDTASVDDILATHNAAGDITGIDDRSILSVLVRGFQDFYSLVISRFAAQDKRIEALEARILELEAREGIDPVADDVSEDPISNGAGSDDVVEDGESETDPVPAETDNTDGEIIDETQDDNIAEEPIVDEVIEDEIQENLDTEEVEESEGIEEEEVEESSDSPDTDTPEA